MTWHINLKNSVRILKQKKIMTVLNSPNAPKYQANLKVFLTCFFGIFVSYLLFGVFQEKM